MPQGVSWAPEDFVQGGLLSDVDVEYTNCRFGYGTYGTGGVTTPAFIADLKVIGTEEVHADQFWSFGDDKDWQPSEDGEQMIAKGGATAPRTGSNFHHLVTSISNVGMKLTAQNTQKASLLNGLKVHVERTKVARTGLKNADKEGNTRDYTVLIATKLIGLPGQLVVNKNGTQAQAKAESTQNAEAKAIEFVLSEAKKGGGTTTWMNAKKAALMGLISQPALRTAVIKLIEDKDWREKQTVFACDGDNIVTG